MLTIEQVPEVVHQDPETGLLSVSYTELVPILIEALKQHLAGYSKVCGRYCVELFFVYLYVCRL